MSDSSRGMGVTPYTSEIKVGKNGKGFTTKAKPDGISQYIVFIVELKKLTESLYDKPVAPDYEAIEQTLGRINGLVTKLGCMQ
mmetsp:Transcript_26191/g.40309  ORF Transcript_26191/g.40309 Transcript_26191/m.40309 type:complete len:83 (+) Transcript_26191:184-432(+)